MASRCHLKSGTCPSSLLKQGPYIQHSTRVKPGFAQHRHVQYKVELTENTCKLSATHTATLQAVNAAHDVQNSRTTAKDQLTASLAKVDMHTAATQMHSAFFFTG